MNKITIEDIKNYYLDLANQANDNERKEYLAQLAAWDQADSFTLGSVDSRTPIRQVMKFLGDKNDAQNYAKLLGVEGGNLQLAFCELNESYYLLQGFSGGCHYIKLTL